jgi:transposase-like protein
VPKLRRQTFETAIIERYRRRESSVEEALIEMYLAGVSVRRVEDITEALWGTRVSPGTVSNLNKKIYAKIEEWRHRPIEGDHPYLYLDGIVMKRTWAGEVRNVSLLVASAVNAEGFREILGICEGAKGAFGWSSRMPAAAWWRALLNICRRRAGSAVWCISIAMSSATSPRPRCARSAIC